MRVCMAVFGALDYSVALTEALASLCEVDFYSSSRYLMGRDPTILDVLRDKCAVHIFTQHRNRDPRNLPLCRRLCKDIGHRGYDVIHIQEYGSPWMAFWWRLCGPHPLVMTIHDPYQHPGLRLASRLYQDVMQSLFVRKADKVITHGAVLKQHVLERYPEKADKDVAVIPHGDLALLKKWEGVEQEAPVSPSTKTILFFGDIRRNKGLEYLLKAEPLVRARVSDYRMLVAGRCMEFERYEKYIEPGARIDVDNRFIPNKEVAAYFRRASFVVLPYISATQSGVVALAYAFGKPVVATRVGAIPEVVEDGKTGLLVEPRDERALADAIVRMLSSEERLAEMGRNAERYCREHLSWEAIAAKTRLVYEEAINEYGPRHEHGRAGV